MLSSYTHVAYVIFSSKFTTAVDIPAILISDLPVRNVDRPDLTYVVNRICSARFLQTSFGESQEETISIEFLQFSVFPWQCLARWIADWEVSGSNPAVIP